MEHCCERKKRLFNWGVIGRVTYLNPESALCGRLQPFFGHMGSTLPDGAKGPRNVQGLVETRMNEEGFIMKEMSRRDLFKIGGVA